MRLAPLAWTKSAAVPLAKQLPRWAAAAAFTEPKCSGTPKASKAATNH